MSVVMRELIFVTSAVCFAAASFYAPGLVATLVALCAMLLLVAAQRLSEADPRVTCRGFVLWGLAFHSLAFWWLPKTLSLFGGFPIAVSIVLFILFAFVSTCQLYLCGWACSRLPLLRSHSTSPGALTLSCLALPLAWGSMEFLVPRLFPWALVHPLIELQPLSALARYVGVAPLSALVLWALELVLSVGIARPQGTAARGERLGGISVVVALLLLGQRQVGLTTDEISAADPIRLGVVQGNLDAKQKGDFRYFEANLGRYRELSAQAEAAGAELLLWPETVVNEWTPERLVNVTGTKYDPYPGRLLPLVYGTLMFGESTQSVNASGNRAPEFSQYNAAAVVDSAGTLLGRYYKRVLMPFGEYLPFASIFPVIKELSPQSGDFTAGDSAAPVFVPLPRGPLPLGLLICYEDLVAGHSREAVTQGAQLLVNLTNDAWYGDTAAPHQHHLLAAWRAIETGRYLVRVTNTGVTGIVDPIGRTIAQLPTFESGVLVEPVRALSTITPYVAHGDWLGWVLVLLTTALLSAKLWISTANPGD